MKREAAGISNHLHAKAEGFASQGAHCKERKTNEHVINIVQTLWAQRNIFSESLSREEKKKLPWEHMSIFSLVCIPSKEENWCVLVKCRDTIASTRSSWMRPLEGRGRRSSASTFKEISFWGANSKEFRTPQGSPDEMSVRMRCPTGHLIRIGIRITCPRDITSWFARKIIVRNKRPRTDSLSPLVQHSARWVYGSDTNCTPRVYSASVDQSSRTKNSTMRS